MALRSPALWMGNPAIQHTAQNDRLFRSGLLRPEAASTASSRPLTAASGVLAGPAGTMGEVTLLSNTQFTVNPGRWMIFGSASALAGSYEVTNDAVATLGVTAQDATQFRRSYFGVWVIDSFVAGSGDDLPHWGLVDGVLAASAVAAALPAAGVLPANFLALGEFLIPPVGQSVTWTPYEVTTGLRGSIIPVGREASLQTVNASGVITVVAPGAYPGVRRYCQDTGAEAVWDGTAWLFYDTRWQTYTPTVSVTNAIPWPEITYGNGSRAGRYKRAGRQVSANVMFMLGTTTTYSGQTGIVRLSYPPNLPPSDAFFVVAGANHAEGTALVNHTGGFAHGEVLHLLEPIATNRRMTVSYPTNVAALSGGSSSTWNISAAGQYVQLSTTYEIA